MLAFKRNFILLLIGALCCIWQSSWPQSLDDVNPEQFSFPAGSAIPVILQEGVSTESAVPGQTISAMVAQDIYFDSHLILSRNDRAFGHVAQATRPISGRNAILKLAFDEIDLVNGIRIPIKALADTGSPDFTWGGELTEGTKPVVVPYHVEGIGSYGRLMYRGPRAMGQQVNIQAGTALKLILQEPVSLDSQS